jgi:hypothetical protein
MDNPTFLLGLALGVVAALALNLGKGIQKQHVAILTRGRRMLSAENRRLLGGWLFGMFLTMIASVPYSMGLKFSGSPSVISAMTGVGLVGLVIYALRVLGEPLGRRDGIGIVLVVIATSTLGYLGGGREGWDLEVPATTIMHALAVPSAVLVALCLAALRLRVRPFHGVAFGTLSGFCIGTSLFLGDVALVKAGGDLIGQLHNPYPYAAMTIGLLALAATQIGFLRAPALIVVPAVNSAAIVTPVFLEGAIYGALPSATTIALITVIIVGVVLLSTGAAARVAGDSHEAAETAESPAQSASA